MKLKNAGSYATDGKCHNADSGTYGHECGSPAAWLGTNADEFTMGFCAPCKDHGTEARSVISWSVIPGLPAHLYGRAAGGAA